MISFIVFLEIRFEFLDFKAWFHDKYKFVFWVGKLNFAYVNVANVTKQFAPFTRQLVFSNTTLILKLRLSCEGALRLNHNIANENVIISTLLHVDAFRALQKLMKNVRLSTMWPWKRRRIHV